VLSKRPALRSHGEKRLETAMTGSERGDRVMTDRTRTGFSRRGLLKGMGAGIGLAGVAGALPGIGGSGRALAAEPLKLGFQVHRTGIGAAYGRWYERTTMAAVKSINEAGGIAGRPIEIVVEDYGTDPKRGAEVVEKFATQHKVDLVFGTLFSHVVLGAAPRAGELKMPYFVVSEGYHVASGKLNRYCFQPGITDVRQQVSSMAPWIAKNLGKKVTMIYPDYAFGYDHRDFFSEAIKKQGGEVVSLIPIPPTDTSFTKYFPKIPSSTEVLYHVMVGPGVLTFVKELGDFYGSKRPQIFGFIDSLEAVDLKTPNLEFLDGTYFWEAYPRYAGPSPTAADTNFRKAVGVDASGASVSDPKDISTYSHMFGCWETLYFIKQAMEAAGYKGPADKAKFIEACEAITALPAGNERPQGAKVFDGKMHQVFGVQSISKVNAGKLDVVHTTSIEDGKYTNDTDYTKMPL
jgi:branched-chain amino acid transport system substrate-binding protein